MIRAVLDSNVIVQSLFANPQSASRGVLDGYFEGRFRPQFSDATLEELLNVLLLPGIRALHQLPDEAVLDFIAALLAGGDQHHMVATVLNVELRDITDIKFLALSEHSQATYLVTNDRRHLLPLKSFRGTRIVTPAKFLRHLH